MADPYYRYGALAQRVTSVSNFPGCLTSETPPSLASSYVPVNELPSDFLKAEISPSSSHKPAGSYHHESAAISGVVMAAGSSGQEGGYLSHSPLKEPPRRDGNNIPDMINGRPSSLRDIVDHASSSVSRKESKVLFVDGLPSDCTRREVGHLFRPFIGYKDIKLIHKEPRHRGDKAMVFCFVEFVDAKCAITAMKALQGYKIDDKKPNSSDLRIEFAHFPLRLPSDRDEQRIGIL